ncbi:hypothetical protein OG393_33570 (plasmid) [Streptomyces sp. NBC_01216]|uniref:hypothetical protein n=1 Tax=Streptomyces sp. NBC_01216 TaxID=2903778 RepID=UPI002E14ED1A|nr:hypothetical protein OG393_33570 [Streptomyces sp. NBC_01216]
MSRHATAYVNSLGITDATVRAVLQLLAELTDAPGDHRRPDDVPDIMGLHLQDSDVPALAVRAGLAPEEFRQQLRGLKQHVKMDVLEHSDGLWEIVYGPSYTRPPKPRPAEPDLTRGGPHPFWLPGWEKYSTWGYEQDPGGHQHLYAQLIPNQDGPDAEPRIWITPPRHTVQTLDELAEVIAESIAPYEPVRMPGVLIKRWLTRSPLSDR